MSIVSDSALASVFDVLAMAGKSAVSALLGGSTADDALMEAVSTIETERAKRNPKFAGQLHEKEGE